MALFTRRDREKVGTAGVALGLVVLMFGFFAFVVAGHQTDAIARAEPSVNRSL